jgi:hypothetical protein
MAKFVFEFEAPGMDDEELDLVADVVRTLVRDMCHGPMKNIIINGNIVKKEEL